MSDLSKDEIEILRAARKVGESGAEITVAAVVAEAQTQDTRFAYMVAGDILAVLTRKGALRRTDGFGLCAVYQINRSFRPAQRRIAALPKPWPKKKATKRKPRDPMALTPAETEALGYVGALFNEGEIVTGRALAKAMEKQKEYGCLLLRNLVKKGRIECVGKAPGKGGAKAYAPMIDGGVA